MAIQLEKSKSRDNLLGNGSDKEKGKPYRSEMNLYLQYDGTNPTISNATSSTPTTAVAASSASESNGSQKLSSRTRSLEREHTDSPAPHMPDPMAPFPEKCTYLGFEQINQAAQGPQSPAGPKTPLAVKPSLPAKPPPPLPPARRPPPVTMPTEPPPPPPPVSGVAPNKSHLYKSLANAAAKRAIFRSAPTQLTRSLDVECTGDEPAEPAGTAGTANEVTLKPAYIGVMYMFDFYSFGRRRRQPSARRGAYPSSVERSSRWLMAGWTAPQAAYPQRRPAAAT